MKINRKKVEFIAKLAGLKLSSKEKKEFEYELSSILDFVEKLSKVKTKETADSFEIEEVSNVFDEDIPVEFTEREKIINLFPEKENDFLKIKAVFGK